MNKWKRSFVWFPEYVEEGDPKRMGWRWLCFGWYRWFEGRYSGDYWRAATHNWDEEAEMSMKKLTGVSGVISAAHKSRDGNLHGHSWQVVAWWRFNPNKSAETRRSELRHWLSSVDHGILSDDIAWGEDLAERIGHDLKAYAVDVSRPLEGIYARWSRD